MKKNLQKRTIVVSILLLLFVSFATNFSFMYVGKKTEEDCWAMLENVASSTEDRVYFSIRSHYGALMNLSNLFSSMNDLKGRAVQSRVRGSFVGPFMSQVRLYLSDGHVVAENGLSFDSSNVKSYLEIYSRKPYVTTVHEDRIHKGQLVFETLMPIMDNGKIVAMISAVTDVDAFDKFVSSNGVDGQISAFVLDSRNGSVLAKSQERREYFTDQWNKDIFAQKLAKLSFKDDLTGKDLYAIAVPSKVPNWMLLTVVDGRIAFERMYTISRLILVLSIIEIIIFFLYLLWVLHEARRKMERESTEYYELADALSDNFDVIFYVNLEDETYEEFLPQKNSKEFAISRKGEKFFSAVFDRLDVSTVKGDSDEFIKFMSKDNLASCMDEGSTISFEFNSLKGEERHYFRLRAVHSKKDRNHVVVAVENIDEEVSTFKCQRKIIERSNKMVESLAVDFECVNYVEVVSDKMSDVAELYRVSPLLTRLIPGWAEECYFHNKLQLLGNYFVSPTDRDKFFEKTRREEIFKGFEKNPVYFVNFRADVDGEERYYQLKIIANKDESNKVLGFVVGIHCIDEEIKQQMVVQRKLERNLQIIDVLSENYTSLYYMNLPAKKLEILSISDRIKKDTGVNLSQSKSVLEALTNFIYTLVHPEDRHLFEEIFGFDVLKEKLHHQKKLNVIFRRNFDGDYKYSQMTIAKVEDVDEEPVNIAIGFVEIDAQYRLESVQRENIERIMNLSDEFECIYDVNLDTSKFRISAKDGKLTQQIVKNLEECDDYFTYNTINIPKSVCEEDRDNLLACMTKEYMLDRLEREPSYFFDYRVMLDGKQVWYKVKITRTQSWHKDHRVLVGIFNNDEIYRREKAQQAALEQALAMARSSSRAKTTFLSNMSHDIRTPMNAITGYAALAKKHIDDTAKLQDYLNKISLSSNHLFSLINDVLDMSRIESGKMSINEKQERLSDIIGALGDIVQADVIAKNLKFDVVSEGIENDMVLCDKLRLNQVLLNILSNAIKYTPAGGAVSMNVSRKQTNEEGYALYEFCIRDNGIGMSAEFLQNIFEPFTREKSSTVSGIQGTGLGMTIAKNIVDMMGGTISIESRENEGTTVTLLIDFKLSSDMPENVKSADAEIAAEPSEHRFVGKNVLLVEDNPLNREIAKEVLEDFGLKVVAVDDGSRAVEVVSSSKSGEYDLIFMDIQMPIMDGYEATRQIRSLPNKELADIPIVAMTANAFVEDCRSALEAGMNDHVAKPVDLAKLQKVLEKFLLEKS